MKPLLDLYFASLSLLTIKDVYQDTLSTAAPVARKKEIRRGGSGRAHATNRTDRVFYSPSPL